MEGEGGSVVAKVRKWGRRRGWWGDVWCGFSGLGMWAARRGGGGLEVEEWAW